jgi:hypothetical protein
MMDFSLETIDLSDFTAQSVETIGLTSQQIATALERSQSVAAPQRWQTYLDALADIGFAQWLQERAPQMTMQPLATGLWQINGWRVRSIAAAAEDEVLIPTLHLTPEMAAHLYVAVTVQEEFGQVQIAGSIQFDQLNQQPWPVEDAAYCVHVDAFASGSNQLLLNLRYADPASIPLPSVTTLSDRITSTQQQLGRSFTNVSRWLNRQMDNVAAELSWVLMPPLTLETAMRSRSTTPTPEQTLTQILQTIANQGIILPPTHQSAYQDLAIGDPALRVYATIGAMPNQASIGAMPNQASIGAMPNQEWSLLIVLGTQSGTALPVNLQLSISDGQNILFEQLVEVARSQSYLYAQVIGAVTEGFQVTITLPDGTSHTLPEFVYAPE